jgi:hypothetical protein
LGVAERLHRDMPLWRYHHTQQYRRLFCSNRWRFSFPTFFFNLLPNQISSLNPNVFFIVISFLSIFQLFLIFLLPFFSALFILFTTHPSRLAFL